MRKPFIKRVLCTSLCAAAIGTAAVASQTGMIVFAAETSSSTDQAEKKVPEEDGSVMAKVTSVDGSKITITTAQKPGEAGKPADGETPPEKPADGETPPEKPADGETPPEKPADGETPPEKPADGETPPEKPADGDSKPEMKFDGETMTVTLTSSTEYTSREDENASASDIAEGSVLRLSLDGTKVVRVDIMK